MKPLELLLRRLKARELNLDDQLPVYADYDRNNPIGVWSWDATHEIVGTCVDDLEIRGRRDAGEEVNCPECGLSREAGYGTNGCERCGYGESEYDAYVRDCVQRAAEGITRRGGENEFERRLLERGEQ